MEGTTTIFFVQMTQKQKQKKLNQFKIFCTGSEKIVPKAKIEPQHMYMYKHFL